MTECCNENGTCTQGRDCPIRKQRAEETNKVYINRNNGLEPDLAEEVFASVKALIAWLALTGCVVMVALAFWGK